ncbi:hypothetical protein FGM00_13900 [Aggregatimonas sangjinii]|uniref:Uncharacterized protein n=1 Tax=Aggregatimonas sangjinii TaxID=2583587 RepID=A0A5B7SWK9_9FLAO|nr:hypothetical protein [Aggregatimonas sangjinii]QCX01150.1 hypothetical protein FGM00_13900 [Aggregatimonas sangjinii]
MGGVGYLTCDELEESVIKKTKFNKGWDDYELNSSFLERVKFYETKFFYTFALAKFKNKPAVYVFCGIPNEKASLFEVYLETGESSGELFNKYISPYKCDCK